MNAVRVAGLAGSCAFARAAAAISATPSRAAKGRVAEGGAPAVVSRDVSRDGSRDGSRDACVGLVRCVGLARGTAAARGFDRDPPAPGPAGFVVDTFGSRESCCLTGGVTGFAGGAGSGSELSTTCSMVADPP